MSRETNIATQVTEAVHDELAPTTRFRADGDPRAAEASTVGIVLAGTQSWGECPLQRVVARPLVPIANRPIVHHMLGWLGTTGLERTSICGNSTTRMLRQSIAGRAWGESSSDNMRIDYYHDISPRGPAGCVRDAAYLNPSDTYVVVEGAILPQFDLSDVLAAHRGSGAALTVVASGARFHNLKGEDATVPIGIYVFEVDALRHIAPTGYQDIKEELIPRLYQCGESVLVYRTDAPAPRVDGVDSYLAVSEWSLTDDYRHRGALSDYQPIGDAKIHVEAKVDSTANLVGPVLIGPRAAVRAGATIVGPTTIGPDSVVASGAVVCRSVIWDHVQVRKNAVLDRCIATSHATAPPDSDFRYRVLTQIHPRFARFGRRIVR